MLVCRQTMEGEKDADEDVDGDLAEQGLRLADH